jgi:hypothetical protein
MAVWLIWLPKLLGVTKWLNFQLKTWYKHVSYYGFVLTQKFNNASIKYHFILDKTLELEEQI